MAKYNGDGKLIEVTSEANFPPATRRHLLGGLSCLAIPLPSSALAGDDPPPTDRAPTDRATTPPPTDPTFHLALRSARVRTAGPLALFDPDIAGAVGLTAEQSARLADVFRREDARLADQLMRTTFAAGGAKREYVARFWRENRALRAVLDGRQVVVFDEIGREGRGR